MMQEHPDPLDVAALALCGLAGRLVFSIEFFIAMCSHIGRCAECQETFKAVQQAFEPLVPA